MSARTRALFFCFSLLTHACAGSEEPGAPIWSRLGANASGDGIAFAPDGDVILVGHLSDPTDLGAGLVLDDWAMFVARDSPEGELRWAKTFEGSVFPYGVVVDADDDIFVAGSFRDEVDFGGDELDSGIYDRTSRSQSFIVSFDGDGEHRWSAGYGDGDSDTFADIVLLADGGIAVAGYANGDIDFGGGELEGTGSFGSNAIVAAFDADGTHRWGHLFGTEGDLEFDQATGLAATPDGGVVVVGNVEGGVDFGGGVLGEAGDDVVHEFVASFGPDGSHRSSRLVDDAGLGPMELQDVAVSPDGETVYVTGSLKSSGEPTPFVAGFDLAGTMLWGHEGTGPGYGNELVADARGVAIAGRADSPLSFAGAEIRGTGKTFFVLALDEAGAVQWANGMDATDDDAVVREPLIATHRSRLGFICTLNGGVTTFEGEPVDLEEEGFIAHVFAR
ncbi:MAG: hypothetical protein CMN30_12890 [Sandaracinus sp.]|nr:hypothetical protein [Sandaracinus sp.]